jgi:cell division initiation protein
MRIAPIDITHRTFSKKMMGVDPQEVYDFLRDVADQMEELVRERTRLKEELTKKDQSLAEYIERDQALRATIQAASKMSDQFRADAEKEASLITSDARQRAEILMKDARDSLKKMYYEIADLKKARMQYETTLRSLMQAHITMLDQSKKIFPEPLPIETQDFMENDNPPEISETMRPTIIGQA